MAHSGEGGPKERDLKKIVEALEIVESEFDFQIMRMGEHVQARTEREAKYHEELKEGYGVSRRYTRILLRYHKGRLERLTETGTTALMEGETGIDDSGRAAAFTGDEE